MVVVWRSGQFRSQYVLYLYVLFCSLHGIRWIQRRFWIQGFHFGLGCKNENFWRLINIFNLFLTQPFLHMCMQILKSLFLIWSYCKKWCRFCMVLFFSGELVWDKSLLQYWPFSCFVNAFDYFNSLLSQVFYLRCCAKPFL